MICVYIFREIGLFTRAIVNSGTNLASWAQPHQKGMGRKRAKQVAQRFNCYIPKDWSQTIDCLRDVPSKNMSAVYYDLFVSELFFVQMLYYYI